MLAERDGTRALTALFRYIVMTNPAATRDVLQDLLPGDGGAEVEETVMNWFQQEIERGRQDGELKGQREGERRGERRAERRVLLKLLRLRFGELPAAVVARVEAAEVPELDLWTERVVSAKHLDDVLESHPCVASPSWAEAYATAPLTLRNRASAPASGSRAARRRTDR